MACGVESEDAVIDDPEVEAKVEVTANGRYRLAQHVASPFYSYIIGEALPLFL